jgi:short-subunit dehydrogenase involved in D-alanine esterification of teichoic acids
MNLKRKISKVDLLINNAGIFKRKEAKSPEGFELTIAEITSLHFI